MGMSTLSQVFRVMNVFYPLNSDCHHKQTWTPREVATVSDQVSSQTALSRVCGSGSGMTSLIHRSTIFEKAGFQHRDAHIKGWGEWK